jgi:hypothetical protein
VLGAVAFPAGTRFYFSVQHPVCPWDPLSLLPQWVPRGAISPRMKPGAEVKNSGGTPALPPYAFSAQLATVTPLCFPARLIPEFNIKFAVRESSGGHLTMVTVSEPKKKLGLCTAQQRSATLVSKVSAQDMSLVRLRPVQRLTVTAQA